MVAPSHLVHPLLWIERGIRDFASGFPVLFSVPISECPSVDMPYALAVPLERFPDTWFDWIAKNKASVWFAHQAEGHLSSAPLYSAVPEEYQFVLNAVGEADFPLPLSHPVEGVFAPFLRDMLYHAEIMPRCFTVFLNQSDALNLKHTFSLTHLDVEHCLDEFLPDNITIENITSAKLPVHGSDNNTLYAFRSHPDGKDHYALVIGENTLQSGNIPLVRIHAECFTGDLLGSLKCDCGSQLQTAVDMMAKEKNGILIYLRQEGRNIGLTNKLRAYTLQDKGYDTVDANLKLGFAMDQRNFAVCGHILKHLGIDNIRLLTNNPSKMGFLNQYGIHMESRVPLKVGHNPHNHDYLQVKEKRAGHL